MIERRGGAVTFYPRRVNLAQIGAFAGVGRVAIALRRRWHDDFPPAIGGTAESPLFHLLEVWDWLRQHPPRWR
ncbi:hypothetical protein ACFQYP_48780 [Nonomuraea antimicrobica]